MSEQHITICVRDDVIARPSRQRSPNAGGGVLVSGVLLTADGELANGRGRRPAGGANALEQVERW